jgi:RNA-directed DNA polymerase
MTGAWTSESMSPQLLKVATRAKRDHAAQFHSLAHLIDVSALQRAYDSLRANAAVGVDGMTKECYGQDLQANLADLHERLRGKRYRHQPIKRVHIPKGNGKTRPLGISALEDKIVQAALRELLEAVYEQDFLDCSYGFRPGRSAHDAIRVFHDVAMAGEVNWVVEADIASFFDQIPRQQLLDLIAERIPDGSIRRLVGKCLHVGVLDGEELTKSDAGTAQGSVLSPLLANVYLHHVLDLWFERDVKPRMRGAAKLIRYADDFILCFEHERDARRVLEVLPKRMAKYGLTLHPDKTRLVPFRRPPYAQQKGKGPGTFDFLGFTLFWRRSRNGGWVAGCKTRRSRISRAIKAAQAWCRWNRHKPIAEQHAGLCRRLRGHIRYFGVNGNSRSLASVVHHVRRAWHKWLNRRSERNRLTWERYVDLLRDFPLPRALICVQIWVR